MNNITFLTGIIGMGLGIVAHSMAGTNWPLPIGFMALCTFGILSIVASVRS